MTSNQGTPAILTTTTISYGSCGVLAGVAPAGLVSTGFLGPGGGVTVTQLDAITAATSRRQHAKGSVLRVLILILLFGVSQSFDRSLPASIRPFGCLSKGRFMSPAFFGPG